MVMQALSPIGSLFGGGGGSDPYEEAFKYMQMIEPMLKEYYDPYIEYGQRAMPTLEEQYAMLLGDPGALYADLGAGFETSPGYEFALEQALGAGTSAMGASGMLGTPAHQQQNMGYAEGLAAQDYQNYMNQMMNMYGMGLSGTQGQLQTGYGASTGLANQLAGVYGSQANLGMSQAASQNQMLASLLGTAGAIGGGMIGGPPGAAAGSAAGSAVGGWL